MNKNPIIRSILHTLSALLLLAGCTKELTEPGSRNDGKMRISFSTPVITDETATPPAIGRESTQSSPRASIAENTTVRVVAYLSGGMTYVADQTYYMNGGKLKPCTVKSDGTFNAVDMQNELALVPDKYDFYAITPALPLNADQKTVTVPNGVDYASSVTSNITVNSDQTLTLTQLSRKSAKIALEIKKADDNTAMTALKMNPSGKGVTISALPASQSITLNTDIPAATGATTLTIPASAFTLNGTTSTATTYLLPRLGTSRLSLSYDLTYTVSGTEESKTVSGSMGNTILEKGKSYTFTLTMRKTGATLTVVDWIESNQEVVTGQELDYTDNGKPWFLIASKDALNPEDGTATMNWYMANGVYDATYNPNSLSACPVGWRVPTRDETVILWAYCKTMGFDNTAYYWSNTNHVNPTQAWTACFKNGVITSSIYIKNQTIKMRCIRDNIGTGQRYPRMEVDKQIITSRDAAGGVKEAAILTSAEITWLNTTNTSITPYNEQSNYNKVSSKLQVAIDDCTTSNSVTASSGSNKYNWVNAYSACKAYSESGAGAGSWRIPTQRELLLVYVFNNKLQKTITLESNIPYWTGAENSGAPEFASYLIYEPPSYPTLSGVQNPKINGAYVRCVRDVQ